MTARIRRYALLRCAQRALYPLRPLPGTLPEEASLREIRARLKLIGPDPEGPLEPEQAANRGSRLEAVDRMINDVTGQLLRLAREAPFSELRAALPQVQATRPHEVEALLDLCLVDDPEQRPLSLIDYLITLLCGSGEAHHRVMSKDPAALTQRLQQVCEATLDYDPEEVRSHIAVLEEAIAELNQSESIEQLMIRMREYKRRIRGLMFVPELLRKLIEYNLCATNRLADEIEAERALHEIDVQSAEPQEAAAPSAATAPVREADRDEEAAVQEIEAALADRLLQRPTPETPAGEVVRALPAALVSPWEREAFGEAEEESPAAPVLRTAVTVGLVLRKLSDVEPALEDLGLDAETLADEWVPRLDLRIQDAIKDSLARGEYTDAKRLSQTRSKYLYRILEEKRKAEEPEDEPAPKPTTTPRPFALDAGSAAPTRVRRSAPSGSRRPRRRRRAAGTKRRAVLATLALVGIGIVVALQLTTQQGERTVRLLSPRALETISPYLESAYRDRLGHGTNLFGTVSEEWGKLGPRRQWKEATDIARRLRQAGIEQVMLFDQRRGLRVHYLGGRLLLPSPPPE